MSGTRRTRENTIERGLVRRAEADGWLVRKVAWIGRHSAPDRLFARDSVVVFIEMKRPGEALRKPQFAEHRRLRRQGMLVRSVDSIEDGLRVLADPHCDETPCEARSREKWAKR